ncbi:hypothetical protein MIMGU_mgv11b009987mg [Erythranthe guttata]|uniref:RING-type domain-containing protein n=1 Tax=Erythranthe guttata TaxID=4155 RepID=A0A022RQQ3_ERYGU|nr:hypothetical protein MIMGU_mgv11b009987mg [Erythranthe guttata]
MAPRGSVVNFFGVAERTTAGYEYRYRFSLDDEIAPLYRYTLDPDLKTYLFEIRTSFIIKTIDGRDQIVDSERFDACRHGKETVHIFTDVSCRLAEYWMTKDEIKELVNKASDFAAQTANDPRNARRSLIPIVVRLEVCTVQQENETVDLVNDRVIRADNLVPICVWPTVTDVGREQLDSQLSLYSLRVAMMRRRVEDIDKELTIMPLCGICSRGPKIGTHISVIPPCDHAFHTHCIVRRLLENNYFCSTCCVRVYPYRFDGPLF